MFNFSQFNSQVSVVLLSNVYSSTWLYAISSVLSLYHKLLWESRLNHLFIFSYTSSKKDTTMSYSLLFLGSDITSNNSLLLLSVALCCWYIFTVIWRFLSSIPVYVIIFIILSYWIMWNVFYKLMKDKQTSTILSQQHCIKSCSVSCGRLSDSQWSYLL